MYKKILEEQIKASKKTKNYLDINPQKEPHKYRIFKEITTHNKCILEDIHNKPWWKSTGIKIGCDVKKLNKKHKYLYPPVTNTKHNFAIISTNKRVKVIEKTLSNNVKRFIFKIL